MTIEFHIIIGIIIYLILGRIFTNILVKFEMIEDDDFLIGFVTIIFPIMIIIKITTYIADIVTKILFEKPKRSKDI